MAFAVNFEARPLLNIDHNPGNQVQANVYEDLRTISEYSPKIFILYLIFAIGEIVTTSVIAYNNKDRICDHMLNTWILCFTARFFIGIPVNIYKFLNHDIDGRVMPTATGRFINVLANVGNMYTFAWWIVGQVWTFGNTNCSTENRVVYIYAIFLIALIYLVILWPIVFLLLICICLPCAFLLVRLLAEKQGATEADINLLPIEIYAAPELTSSSSEQRGESMDTCAICMVDYEVGDELRALRCSHRFHKTCIDQWLPIKKTCPYCRKSIIENNLLSRENSEEQSLQNLV